MQTKHWLYHLAHWVWQLKKKNKYVSPFVSHSLLCLSVKIHKTSLLFSLPPLSYFFLPLSAVCPSVSVCVSLSVCLSLSVFLSDVSYLPPRLRKSSQLLKFGFFNSLQFSIASVSRAFNRQLVAKLISNMSTTDDSFEARENANKKQKVAEPRSSVIHLYRTPEERPASTVVSPSEWIKARKDLLEKEKELMRAYDLVVKQRQELPWVRVEKDYVFDGEHGPTSLSQLFNGKVCSFTNRTVTHKCRTL